MKSVCYEHQAAAAVDTARVFWPRVDDVLEMMDWTLARDPTAGVPLLPGSPLRVIVFVGAKSLKLPTIECTFEVQAQQLVYHDLEFSAP